MKIINSFDIIDAHLESAPFRFVTGGVPALRGKTMTEKMLYMQEHYDWMRKRIMCEAGGKRALCGGVLMEPISDEADFGVFYFDDLKYQPMCGGGSLSLAHTVASMGLVELKEPETKIVFETPAGLITTYVEVKNGEITGVTLENVPAFLYKKDVKVSVDGVGDLTVDLGFGGNWFVLCDVEQAGLEIKPENRGVLADTAMKIIAAVNEVESVEHPENPDLNFLDQLLWCEKTGAKGEPQNAQCVYGDYKLDDCPCGTGTNARMARMYTRGELTLDDEFIQQNNINKEKKQFYGKYVKETKVGDLQAVVTRVTSRNAAVTGFGKFVITEGDQYKAGFREE